MFYIYFCQPLLTVIDNKKLKLFAENNMTLSEAISISETLMVH